MYGFVITTAGEAMLARAAAGEALVLDAVMVGRGVVESAAAAKALNTLIDPVAAATSTAPAVSGNQISMTVEYRNDLNGGLEAGFALSEFGISAHVGDDPAALLYYGSLGDAPQPVKPASEGLDVHRFPVAIAVTGEVSVTLEYPAGGFLTEDDLGGLNFDPAGSAEKVQNALDAHIADKQNPHGVTAEQVPYDNSRTELASDTAQGAIDELYARMYGDLKVRIQVYETGTTTPISGVAVTGISDELGGVLYADDSGVAEGTVLSGADSAQVTVQVDTRYIDLTEQTSETVTVQKGALKEVTLYATRVSNPSGKIETFTASTQKMFTDAVDRADVHCVGAGAGGSSGGGSNTYSGSGEWPGAIPIAEGGQGGEGGKSSFKISVPFQSNKPFDITVGSKGIGGKASSQSSTNCSKNKGTSGGSSECLGVSAKGGANPTTIGAECTLYLPSNQWPVAETASDNETHLFGDSLLQIAGGGDGGGGSAGAYNTSNTTWYHKGNSVGGAPNGGNGGGSVSATGAGKNAKGPGGGGGGGSGITKGKTADQNVTFSGYDGGDGYDGIVYLRWFYA
mgnify:CR=1 FL=1